MKQWLVTHVDALIPIVFGIVLGVQAFFKRESLTLEEAKSRKLLPTLAGALVMIGVFRLFTDPTIGSHPPTLPERRELGPEWKPIKDLDSLKAAQPVTVTTDDGLVSAEFPEAPVRREAVDGGQEIQVRRVTRECDLEGGRINLRLSFNQYAPGIKGLGEATLLANLEQTFKQQGFVLLGNPRHLDSIWAVTFERPADGARMATCIWFGPEGIYRVLATTQKGLHDDPRAARLISSFQRTSAAQGN